MIAVASSRLTCKVNCILRAVGLILRDTHWLPRFAVKYIVVGVLVQFKLALSNCFSGLFLHLGLLQSGATLAGFVLGVQNMITVTTAGQFTNLIFFPPDIFALFVFLLVLLHKLPPLKVSVKLLNSFFLNMLLFSRHFLSAHLFFKRCVVLIVAVLIWQVGRGIRSRLLNLRVVSSVVTAYPITDPLLFIYLSVSCLKLNGQVDKLTLSTRERGSTPEKCGWSMGKPDIFNYFN